MASPRHLGFRPVWPPLALNSTCVAEGSKGWRPSQRSGIRKQQPAVRSAKGRPCPHRGCLRASLHLALGRPADPGPGHGRGDSRQLSDTEPAPLFPQPCPDSWGEPSAASCTPVSDTSAGPQKQRASGRSDPAEACTQWPRRAYGRAGRVWTSVAVQASTGSTLGSPISPGESGVQESRPGGGRCRRPHHRSPRLLDQYSMPIEISGCFLTETQQLQEKR